MVKKITISKRDREKLKEQKRKEKQQRKEERQSNGPSSFEDMIAYVDQFGVLHSVPQERLEEVVDASHIEVSVPKQEDVEVAPLMGRIEYFNAAKGYGFVKDTDNGEKYFFHISSAPATIAEGDRVTFEIERGMRGMNAARKIIMDMATIIDNSIIGVILVSDCYFSFLFLLLYI